MLGLDHKDYSKYALEWAMNELFEDNDELVILRVIDACTALIFYAQLQSLEIADRLAEKAQLEAEGKGDEDKAYKEEATRLLDTVIAHNTAGKAVFLFSGFLNQQLNVVIELVVGRFQDEVHKMVYFLLCLTINLDRNLCS
jgi:Universal stress protein family